MSVDRRQLAGADKGTHHPISLEIYQQRNPPEYLTSVRLPPAWWFCYLFCIIKNSKYTAVTT